jgi:hypothetical protein
MDSAYLVAGIVVAAIAIYFARYEINRHKRANAKLREIHARHLAKSRSMIVERLDLRTSALPTPDQDIYSKVVDLYDQPELMIYPQRIAWARKFVDAFDAEAIVYYWNVEKITDFDDDELFVLWMEKIIKVPATNAET